MRRQDLRKLSPFSLLTHYVEPWRTTSDKPCNVSDLYLVCMLHRIAPNCTKLKYKVAPKAAPDCNLNASTEQLGRIPMRI